MNQAVPDRTRRDLDTIEGGAPTAPREATGARAFDAEDMVTRELTETFAGALCAGDHRRVAGPGGRLAAAAGAAGAVALAAATRRTREAGVMTGTPTDSTGSRCRSRHS